MTILEQIARCEVANRPGRLEPRVLNDGGMDTSS